MERIAETVIENANTVEKKEVNEKLIAELKIGRAHV